MTAPSPRLSAAATLAAATVALFAAVNPLGARAQTRVDVIDVEPVWSGHPVGFSLLTHPPHQYVAYYDAQRQMTVAQRTLEEKSWTFARLPSRLAWDSHNSVTMAIDRAGFLHVAGNMHCVPLVYFRSQQPGDANSLAKSAPMVGPEREQRVTYPVFLRGPAGELIFRYRDGGSGNGDDLYNVYDESSRRWRRLVDGPLVDGGGERNAYCTAPTKGPDGRYHMVWVWRDTPDCATNHDLSYARSLDLVHWESAFGDPLDLPMTVESAAAVDPVPAGGGLINGGHRLGFDAAGQPVIAYHKYDHAGRSQIFAARPEGAAWVIRQVSRWEGYRWDFGGGGTIGFEVRLGEVSRVGASRLCIECSSPRGSDRWWLDARSLEPDGPPPAASLHSGATGISAAERTAPSPVGSAIGLAAAPEFPGLAPRSSGDLGGDGHFTYRLHWFTLGPNRDRPHPEPLPPPSLLQVGVYAERAE